MDNPAISVIMGVHNGARTLKRAVSSILNQTFNDFEFIICDDCSSDETLSILQKLRSQDDRIVILSNEQNLGLSATLNKCIGVARGRYIARMDDDDVSHSERFEKQFSFLESHPEISIVGCRRNAFDEQGIWATSDIEGELSRSDVFSGRFFTHPTVMMRKKDIEEVGGYTVSPRTMRGQDFDLWCKMFAAGNRGYILSDVLFDYYEDRNSIKEPKFKTRFYNFQTHMLWRGKLGLSMKYDIYAWKEILARILPSKLLVLYKQKRK